MYGDTSQQQAGLYREDKDEPDITCHADNGAALTIEDGSPGIRFRKFWEFDPDAFRPMAEAAE